MTGILGHTLCSTILRLGYDHIPYAEPFEDLGYGLIPYYQPFEDWAMALENLSLAKRLGQATRQLTDGPCLMQDGRRMATSGKTS